VTSLTQPRERASVDRLIAQLTVTPVAAARGDSAVAGLTVVFTGTLERMTRAEARRGPRRWGPRLRARFPQRPTS